MTYGLQSPSERRHAMRLARNAHRARKTAYATARRQGRIVPFDMALPSWAEDDNASDVASYIVSQFAPYQSTIEE